MSQLKAIILAAGKGTRMQSELPKVVHKVLGKTMVEYVIEAAREAGASEICLVVGHKAEVVKEAVGDGVIYVEQKEQLGTGHAVKCAKDFIGETGDVLVLCGDTPLIQGKTLKELVDYHRAEGHGVTVLSTILEDATGYGRIIRDKGAFIKNVEHKDATEEERAVREINSGMYVFQAKALSDSLANLNNDNAQKEYYLPDTLSIIRNAGMDVEAMTINDIDEIRGVNTVEQLKEAEEIMKNRGR